MTDASSAPDARPWTAVCWVVVDVEGNGQHPPDLVEAAAVAIIGGLIGEPRSWLVRPPRPITWQARRVHGITQADLANAPGVAEIESEIVAELRAADVVIGHNVHIDLDVLTRSLPSWMPPPSLDTLRLARAVHPGLPSYRLGALTDHFDLHDHATAAAHRARTDAVLAGRLLVRLATDLGDTPSVGQLRRAASGATSRPVSVPSQGSLDLGLG